MWIGIQYGSNSGTTDWVWRSTDGINWNPANTSGIDNATNGSLTKTLNFENVKNNGGNEWCALGKTVSGFNNALPGIYSADNGLNWGPVGLPPLINYTNCQNFYDVDYVNGYWVGCGWDAVQVPYNAALMTTTYPPGAWTERDITSLIADNQLILLRLQVTIPRLKQLLMSMAIVVRTLCLEH